MANGSIGGILKPGPKLPWAKLGWSSFTDRIIQSAKFLSLREQTFTVEAEEKRIPNLHSEKINSIFEIKLATVGF